jgi:hypothetical protein
VGQFPAGQLGQFLSGRSIFRQRAPSDASGRLARKYALEGKSGDVFAAALSIEPDGRALTLAALDSAELEISQDLLEKGKFEAAAARLQPLIERSIQPRATTSVSALAAIATALWAAKRPSEAAQLIDAAMSRLTSEKEHPRHGDDELAVGNALVKMGRMTDASALAADLARMEACHPARAGAPGCQFVGDDSFGMGQQGEREGGDRRGRGSTVFSPKLAPQAGPLETARFARSNLGRGRRRRDPVARCRSAAREV